MIRCIFSYFEYYKLSVNNNGDESEKEHKDAEKVQSSEYQSNKVW